MSAVVVPNALQARRFDALAIGASAGGVEALSQLLPALTPPCAAVLVVLHQTRERPSLLCELFAPRCSVPVQEAMDKQPIQASTIYFASPDYHLLIDSEPQQGPERQAHLALSVDETVNYSRPAIDVLFESAADVYRGRLLGVLLTGASADGALGLAAIQRAGGATIVQDPDTAVAPYMPSSALRELSPDLVLPLSQIAAALQQLACHSSTRAAATESNG